jgi:exodeoxyribonuclease VII small subunit
MPWRHWVTRRGSSPTVRQGFLDHRLAMSNARPKNFETSLEELERIVRELEQGELTLEKSLELFEQGVKLSRECQERLNQAERRIEILMRDNQGRATVRPFDPESELSGGIDDG